MLTRTQPRDSGRLDGGADRCVCLSAWSAPSVRVNGVRVDLYAAHELPDIVARLVECGRSHVVHFLPAHPIVLAEHNKVYRDTLNRGDLNLVDGAAVALATRLYGHRATRTTGSGSVTWRVAPTRGRRS